MKMSYLVGLTGGIASGKSVVSNYLKQKGIPIIDADVVAREVVEPGTRGLQKIVDHFGTDYLTSEQTLDRKKLGQLIFSNEAAREQLAVFLDQAILDRMQELTAAYRTRQEPLIVWDMALLIEKNYQSLVDEVLLVSVAPDIQVERLMARDHISAKEAKQKIASQLPLQEKKRFADLWIDNSGTLDETYRQIDHWLENLKERM